MSDLVRIKNVANELWDIADKARSNFGEEGYKALEKAANEVANAWRICKIGQDEKLNNAYRTPVNNSRKPIKSSNLPEEVYYIVINGAKQYFENREKAKEMAAELGVGDIYTETGPEEIQELYEVGYIGNSRKPIKSSLEDRLVPYLEEFEEGYADALTSTDEMGSNVHLDTFYEVFKSDHNLSDDDISKLEGAVQDIWHETEEDTEHDMGEMYGAPHGATPEEALKHFE